MSLTLTAAHAPQASMQGQQKVQNLHCGLLQSYQDTGLIPLQQDWHSPRLLQRSRVDRRHGCCRFNDPSKGVFAFLLSTRAGGQGLNLTGADTVIIHDCGELNAACCETLTSVRVQ